MAEVELSLYDAALQHELRVRLHGNHIAEDVAKLLDEVERDLTAQLAAAATEAKRERTRSLLAGVRSAIVGVRRAMQARTLDHMEALADYEAVTLADLYSATIGGTFDKPSADSIMAAVKAEPFHDRRFAEWWSGWSKAALDRATALVRLAQVEGTATGEVTTQIKDALDVSRRSAAMIARTGLTHLSAEARGEFMRGNPRLNAVIWVSTLDGRTSPICSSRDGRVYPADSGPRPPAHHNCRSTVIPFVAEPGQIGTKVADLERPFVVDTRAVRDIPKSERDGKIGRTSGESYGDWLRRQDSGFIRDVLGPTKARLFLDGKLSIDAFADEISGRAWSLAELRQREAAAFKRAGF